MLVTAFLIVTGPRLSAANEKFGNPFHSYQNYFVWLEDASSAIQFQRDYPDRDSLETLTFMTRPGPLQFIQENGFQALVIKAGEGAAEQLKASALGRSGWILFYGLFVFLVVAVIHRIAMRHQSEEVWRVRGASARWMLLFILVMTTLTLFHAGVGNAVIPGNAMITALFIPLLLTFIWIAERYRRQLQRSSYATVVNRVYCGLMILPIVWVTVRIAGALSAPVS